ncbi:hypothetical protein GF326_12795 [Candidatus Bathyarchaeota archaeon]|nr:hypothetical protein [Candidatus Bathyarchaeota archaeon]
MKKHEKLLISAFFGIAVIIVSSLPLIEVSVDDYYLEIREVWFESEIHVNYPVTVENDWNCSAISYDLIDDRFYIYWVVPVAQDRDVDFHIKSNENPERMVFSEDEFVKFQQGKSSDKIIEKDRATGGTLSFVSSSSGEYVFVCIFDSELKSSDEFSLNVSWLFSTLEKVITSYRTEIEYLVKN